MTVDIQRAVMPSISHPASTVDTWLHDTGLYAWRPLQRLHLTPRQRLQGPQWCHARLSWSDSEWQWVIFSDESRFSLGGDDQRICVWRHRGQHQDERFVVGLANTVAQHHTERQTSVCVAQ